MLSAEGIRVVDALGKMAMSMATVRHLALAPGSIWKGVMFDAEGRVSHATENGDSIETLSQLFTGAITDLDIAADSINGSVTRHVGVIGASNDLIAAVQELNLNKLHLKEAAAAITGDARERAKVLRDALGNAGFPVAHPLQCWRLIPITKPHPIKTLGFSRVKQSWSSEVIKKSVALARIEQYLTDDPNDPAWTAAEMLREWSCSEVKWQVPVSEFGKANISYRIGDGLANNTLYASLPILVHEGMWPERIKNNPLNTVEIKRKADAAPGEVIPLPFRHRNARIYRSLSAEAHS